MKTPRAETTSPFDRAVHTFSETRRKVILSALENVLSSQFFRNSPRSKSFLSYVVQKAIDGRGETLKERTIGIEVFDRPSSYSTGEDPVVRVHAGDVRRRLKQYYDACEECPTVRIELPVGGYIPTFHTKDVASSSFTEEVVSVPEPETVLPTAVQALQDSALRNLIPFRSSTDSSTKGESFTDRPSNRISAGFALLLLGMALGAMFAVFVYRKPPIDLVERQFWGPALKNPQPLLIYLPQPVVYAPQAALFDIYAKTHPGEFENAEERLSRYLPLDPEQAIKWKDLAPAEELGMNAGDTSASIGISTLTTKLGKQNHVWIGQQVTYSELRSSPSVLIGGFSNPWAVQALKDKRFSLGLATNGIPSIRESGGQNRIWQSQTEHNHTWEDFGLITRIPNSENGQFMVFVTGIHGKGTEAASECLTTPECLNDALSSAPPDWENRNLQIVIRAEISEILPNHPQDTRFYKEMHLGKPHVVATYSW